MCFAPRLAFTLLYSLHSALYPCVALPVHCVLVCWCALCVVCCVLCAGAVLCVLVKVLVLVLCAGERVTGASELTQRWRVQDDNAAFKLMQRRGDKDLLVWVRSQRAATFMCVCCLMCALRTSGTWIHVLTYVPWWTMYRHVQEAQRAQTDQLDLQREFEKWKHAREVFADRASCMAPEDVNMARIQVRPARHCLHRAFWTACLICVLIALVVFLSFPFVVEFQLETLRSNLCVKIAELRARVVELRAEKQRLQQSALQLPDVEVLEQECTRALV